MCWTEREAPCRALRAGRERRTTLDRVDEAATLGWNKDDAKQPSQRRRGNLNRGKAHGAVDGLCPN